MTRIERIMPVGAGQPGPDNGQPGPETGPKSSLASLTLQEQQIVREALLNKLFPTPEAQEELKKFTPDQVNTGLDSWVAQNIKTPEQVEEYINSPLAESRRRQAEAQAADGGGNEHGGPPKKPEGMGDKEWEISPEGKSPDDVVDIMLTIYNMEAEKREAYAAQFQQAVDILMEYAKDNKLLGLEWEVSDLKQKGVKADQKVIDQAEQVNPGNGEKLLNLISQLDKTELFIANYNKHFASHEYDKLADESELKEFKTRYDKYVDDEVELREEITALTKDSDFLKNRDTHNKAISAKEAELEIIKQAQQAEEAQKGSTEADIYEKYLEKKLLLGKHPGNVVHEATFEQQKQSGAAEGLRWYFHEARDKGLFSDLDDLLERKYIEWFEGMTTRRMPSQAEAIALSGRLAPPKSYAEIETEIIAYFQALLPDSKDPDRPNNVEHEIRWDGFVEEGLSTQERDIFKGIRGEYMKRARSQIMIVLKNVDRSRKNQDIWEENQARASKGLPLLPMLSIIQTPAWIPGEWNVVGLQREIAIRARRQELAAEAEPLYERESYYRINLKGKDRGEIETGADQAAEDIMRSFNDFDFDAIKIRIQTLSEAIQGRRELILATERAAGRNISESDAQAIVDSIKDRIENKVNFHLMEWAGGNLQMGLFTGLMGRYVQSRGCERLKEFPAMSDGLVGIATKLLLSRKYRLHYRPQGWKGQMRDDDTTHKLLRGIIQGKVADVLMDYELKGGNARAKLTKVHSWEDLMVNFQHKGLIPINGEGKKQYITLEQYLEQVPQDTLLSVQVPDLEHPGRVKSVKIPPLENYKQIEPYLTVAQKASYRDYYYNYILDKVQNKGDNATFEDLDSLRIAREVRVKEFIAFRKAKEKASIAVTVANQVLDNLGESAEMGDPSIIMENGDFMSIGEVKLALKFAVLEAGAAEVKDKDGKKYKISDSLLNRRERANAWLNKVTRIGNDRLKVPDDSKSFAVILPSGEKVSIGLAKGFEETGLTQHQWDKLKEAWDILNQNGYLSVIKGVKFQDIIKREELKPLRNNYQADYKSAVSQINSPKVREDIARGRLPTLEKILRRLGLGDRDIKNGVAQQVIDQYTQLIEDSRSFDARIDELVYYLATHSAIERTADGEYPEFNADALDFGFQNLNWGVKRLRYLPAFWITNLNRTVPRGADLLYWMPRIDRLAGEMDFENILDLALNVNTSANGMESVDNPALIQFASRLENLTFIRGKGEGSIAKGEGGMDKDWGWNEKWMVDGSSAVKAIEGVGTAKDALRNYLSNATNQELEAEPFGLDQAEKWVDAITNTLGRLKPLLVANEALLGENRQALSSGAGYEDNMLKMFRYSEWIRSKKGSVQKVSRREQGGSVAQEEIEDIIQLLMTPGTFIPGRKYKMLIQKEFGVGREVRNNKTVILEKSPSIWEEAMRKLTPSHNPGLPDREQTYVFKLIEQTKS